MSFDETINLEFLKKFVNAPSPTGSEEPAQKLYQDYLKDIADEIKTDVLGNVDAVLNPNGKPRIVLMGHVDEVGLQVRYISDKGFIYFNPLGGLDAHLLPSKRITILAKSGNIFGVIGKKAIHLQEPDERKKVIKIQDQYIDVGARSREEVEKMGIQIGDPIIFNDSFAYLGNNGDVVSRCFDDKIGAFIIAEVLRYLKQENIEASIHAVSSVQEEIGTRGAVVSAFSVDPDVGIAFDVTHTSDTPGIKEADLGIKKLGGGPVIVRGPNINPKLYELFVKTAEELEIPLQISAASRPTGTDARSIQMTRAGVATGLIGIPNRYMHSMTEIVNLKDVEQIVKLTVAVIKKITKDTSFIPE
ncbi:MAG: M42 family metallopeptidase [Candidatus Lokiarchaeota archaeon]|nr:M42 family metallopeptidase [Candidatus Harpocratesius repetitus]